MDGQDITHASSAAAVTIADQDLKMIKKRRSNLRDHSKAALLVAGIELTLLTAIFLFTNTSTSLFWGILAGGLVFASLHPICASVMMFWQSNTPPARVRFNEDEAQAAWVSSNRLLTLLGREPSDVPDPELVDIAQKVVNVLAAMTSISLGKQGMYGYPPRHTTGDGATNYESDRLDDHVRRTKIGLASLMEVIAGTEDVPGTEDDLQKKIGEVAAPLRIALRYHGIRIRDLDDGRTTATLRKIETFNVVPEIRDPLKEIEGRIGSTEGVKACLFQRDRLMSVGIATMSEDLATEARTVIDRHIPKLAEQTAKAYDSADADGRQAIAQKVDAALNIITGSLRTIADTHAAAMRSMLDEHSRYLASRNPSDPLSGR